MPAACGKDLPGNVYALPVELSRDEMAHYVTQDNDALEMSVTAEPLEEGVSISGVQPKVGAIKDGDRCVGRTKDHDTHIIGKLPVVATINVARGRGAVPQAGPSCGCETCEAYLEPPEKLALDHGYDRNSPTSTRRSDYSVEVRANSH
jgi:serine/threonine-protein kinase HipA